MINENYDLNDDVNNVVGPVTISPGLLNRWDQGDNSDFYNQLASTGGNSSLSTSTASGNESAASTPANDNSVTGIVYPPDSPEGIKASHDAEIRGLYEEIKKLKNPDRTPFFTDKGDHYEINVPPTDADWIAAGVGGTVGVGLGIAGGLTPPAVVGGAALGTYTGYKTKQALTGPIWLPKPSW